MGRVCSGDQAMWLGAARVKSGLHRNAGEEEEEEELAVHHTG